MIFIIAYYLRSSLITAQIRNTQLRYVREGTFLSFLLLHQEQKDFKTTHITNRKKNTNHSLFNNITNPHDQTPKLGLFLPGLLLHSVVVRLN